MNGILCRYVKLPDQISSLPHGVLQALWHSMYVFVADWETELWWPAKGQPVFILPSAKQVPVWREPLAHVVWSPNTALNLFQQLFLQPFGKQTTLRTYGSSWHFVDMLDSLGRAQCLVNLSISACLCVFAFAYMCLSVCDKAVLAKPKLDSYPDVCLPALRWACECMWLCLCVPRPK